MGGDRHRAGGAWPALLHSGTLLLCSARHRNKCLPTPTGYPPALPVRRCRSTAIESLLSEPESPRHISRAAPAPSPTHPSHSPSRDLPVAYSPLSAAALREPVSLLRRTSSDPHAAVPT